MKKVIAVLVLTLMVSGVYIPPIKGDINNDGAVNLEDLALLGLEWGKGCGEGEHYYRSPADLYSDGCIDLKDLAVLGKNWRG